VTSSLSGSPAVPGVATTAHRGAVPERARQVRTFEAGLELFRRIAAVAEAEGHHPDLHLEGYNHAYAQLSTHSVGARRVWLAGDACVDGLPELGGAPDARPLSPQAV